MRYGIARIEGMGGRSRDIGSTMPRRAFGDPLNSWPTVALLGLDANTIRFADDVPAGSYQVQYMTGAVRFYDHPAGTHKWLAASWQSNIVTRVWHSDGNAYVDFLGDSRSDSPQQAMARCAGEAVDCLHAGGWIGVQFRDSRDNPTLYMDNLTYQPLEFRLVPL